AQERHKSFGKTEMWYIMQADKDAELNIGFKESISEEEYLNALESGKLTALLNFEKVEQGDSIFLNAGKVHSIGGGIVLAEIQQTSDITYRIYDWDRVDANGNPRELHTESAVEAIDFEKKSDYRLESSKKSNTSNLLKQCPYFTTNLLPVNGHLEKDYTDIDSFVIFMCVSGRAEIAINGNSEILNTGETVLIPAIQNNVHIDSLGGELLEIYVEA
ncbi:class I mannose-6-phosphate isomerase, partial [Aegicerativicinus sediminis]